MAAAYAAGTDEAWRSGRARVTAGERQVQCALLRDLVGNPSPKGRSQSGGEAPPHSKKAPAEAPGEGVYFPTWGAAGSSAPDLGGLWYGRPSGQPPP
jgi:hypothetical protein